MEYLEVLDMTNLFTKEILLYSLFDLRFKKPVRFMLIVYFVLTFFLWTVPLFFLFFKNHINPYSVAFLLIPPFALANVMSKPIWNNKSFFSWLKCQIRFIFSAKYYYDNRAIKFPLFLKFNNQFTVSRTRDFYKLYAIQKELHEARKGVL